MYTGNQTSLQQPNCCSTLMGRMWSHKQSPELRDRGKSPPKKKMKFENTERSEPEKGKNKNEVNAIASKLKKVTCTLPRAIQSNEAYGSGEKSCETCSITREKYKSDLQAARVVGILVDSVVEREQIEKMDESDNEDDKSNAGSEKSLKTHGKGNKLSLKFSIYCEDDVVKHNLKCVLITLQKLLGDLMVQVCFVKTRKLGNEGRYKNFNISISDLKLLKYEYTNLTDAIVPLLKEPSSNKKDDSDVCVPCVKEKLCEYSSRLKEILKSGRNLQVVMRNDGESQEAGKCCFRDYPHVHADVQGKPIVLKYSMPFQVKPAKSSKTDDMKTDQSGSDTSIQNPSSTNQGNKPQNLQKKTSKQEVPYNDWPEELSNQDKTLQNPVKVDSDDKNADEPQGYSEDPQAFSEKPSKDVKIPEQKSENSIPNQSSSKPPLTPTQSETSLKSKTSSASSLISNNSQKTNSSRSSITSNHKPGSSAQVLPAVVSTSSVFSKESNKRLSSGPQKPAKNPVGSKESNLSKVDNKSAKSNLSASSKESSLYCGCNYDKAYKKLGYQPESEKPPAVANEYSWNSASSSGSSSSESMHSSVHEQHKKNNDSQYPFLNKPNSTPAFPIITTQPSVLTFTQSSSKTDGLSNVNSKSQNVPDSRNKTGRTPFGAETDNIGVYAAKVDSLVLTKERWSQGAELSKSSVKMNVSPEDKSVVAAFKPFIDEPQYEVRNISKKDNILINSHRHLDHQDNKLEILRYLGRDNLLSLCCPADCCKTNSFLEANGSNIELPFSPSLYSLPLDHNDIEYLSKATGKPVSNEDIMVLAEKEILAKDNEWEKQYNKDSSFQHTSKWLRAYGNVDEHKENCDNVSFTHTNAIRRGSIKNVIIKEEPRLSTIVEEGPFCFSDDERPSIPYMPSIPSLPLDEEEKAELIKKCRPSILKHTTMELRYFTVELTEDVEKAVKKDESPASDVVKLNHNVKCKNMHKNCPTINIARTDNAKKTDHLLKTETENKSCDSFHSCSSSTELMNINYERIGMNSTSENELVKNHVDKITMLNAIHLCDENYENGCILNNSFKFPKKTSLSNIVGDNAHYNCISSSDIRNLSESKQVDNKGCIPEINDNYVRNLMLNEDQNKQNRSYTIVQNSDNKISCIAHTNCLVREKTQPMTERNNKAESSNYSKALSSPQNDICYNTAFNSVKKGIKNDKFISIDHNSPKYISVKLNKSYTIVKGINHKEIFKSNFIDNKDNTYESKMSYTVIKNKEREKNMSSLLDYAQKRDRIKYSGNPNSYAENCELKTDNSSQCKKCKPSNWTKLKLDKSNVKKYIADQKQFKQKIDSQETKIKQFKDLKRKPMLLPRSCFLYRRMECAVTLTKIHFPNIQPIRANFQIPLVLFTPKKFPTSFNHNEKQLDLNQFKSKVEKTQEPFYDAKRNRNIYKPTCTNLNQLEQSFQQIKNYSNLQFISEDKTISAQINYFDKQIFAQLEDKTMSMNARSEDVYPLSSNLEIITMKNKSSLCSLIVESKNNNTYPEVKGNECANSEHFVFDEDYNPVYLFDNHGRPLTDQSGRTLRNIKGDSLIIFDEQKNPIRDLDNNLICDSLGHACNDEEFNPVKPICNEDVLKTVVKDSGDVILLYDIEGRPLTSISGTMLVDCSGKSMVRFGYENNKISDHIGRPIFSSNGEQFNSFT